MKVTVVTAAVPAAAIPFRASIFLVYVSQVVDKRLVCFVSKATDKASLLDRVARPIATVIDTGKLEYLELLDLQERFETLFSAPETVIAYL